MVKDLISISWHHRQAQDVDKQTFQGQLVLSDGGKLEIYALR